MKAFQIGYKVILPQLKRKDYKVKCLSLLNNSCKLKVFLYFNSINHKSIKMRKSLFITLLLAFNLSFAQVYTMHGVRVLPENQELFEKIETKYVSKVAQNAVNEGKMLGWGLIKINQGIGENEGFNYVFVNSYKDIDQMNQNNNWWSNTEKVLGIEPDVLFRNLIEESARYFYKQQMEIQGNSPSKHVAFFFGKANNINEYLKIEKIWFGWHKKNMSKIGMTAWGVGTKFLPVNRKQSSNVMTWNLFDKKADIMRFVAGEDFGTSPMPKTNAAEIMPKGWENIVIGEILSFTSPKK